MKNPAAAAAGLKDLADLLGTQPNLWQS